MKRSTSLILAVVAISHITVASAECARDTSGMETHSKMGDTVVEGGNARTPEDFATAYANHMFFSDQGMDIRESFMNDQSHWSDGILGFFGGTPAHRQDFSAPICSNVGQCAQGHIIGNWEPEITGTISGTAEGGAVVAGGSITLTANTSELALTGYTVQIDMGNGEFAIVSWDIHEVQDREGSGLAFPLPSQNTDQAGSPDDACRDNEGNEIPEESPPTGGGGGGGEPPDTPWDTGGDDGPWNDPRWEPCTIWDCWATPTGVACRAVSSGYCRVGR
ncbi:MAG: hypothetical protein QNJ11_19055 [Woeseiaceae bacterium]|nr:hypothetical protein [Woeseiaceae bacterium]